MSIVSYTGLPGAGKSYSVVEHVIIPSLSKKRRVLTNIPVDIDALEALIGFPVNLEKLDISTITNNPDYWSEIEPGTVVCIDECWRFWPAGLKANDIPDTQKSFFAEHRHKVGEDGYSQEIVLVTQDLAQVCKFARDLVEETFRIVKLSAVGQQNKFRVDVYQGAVTGQQPPQARRIRQIFGLYKPEIYNVYSSHTMGTGAAGVEEKADDRANVLKSTLVRFGIPLSLTLVGFGVYFVFQFFNSFGSKEEIKIVETQNKQNITTKTTQVTQAPINPRSTQWRLSGFITAKGAEYAVLDGERAVKFVPARSCRQIHLQWSCMWEGQQIDYYTGPPVPYDNRPITPWQSQDNSIPQ